jgi:carbamoyl-phosphate synthase small subunit
MICHELANHPSNFRNQMTLNEFLIENQIPGLQNINTRKLTITLRDYGVMRGKICSSIKILSKIIKEIKSFKPIEHVKVVTRKKIETIGNGKYKIALLDFGVKGNIVQSLLKNNTTITLFPANTNYQEILSIKPNGILLSNGPGDPQDNKDVIKTIKKLYDSNIPILGICLGHQLLALATGMKTKKLKYGHRGPNHPVKNLETGRIYISSQNHGYYIDEKSLKPNIAKVTYRNVNDKTIEGLKYKNKKIVTVQFHPEACAGPQDTSYLFNDFIDQVKHYAKNKKHI